MHRSRRDILASLAAASVIGCRGSTHPDGTEPDPATRPEPEPGDIDTIVLCMMENRSFDHVFGSLSLVEGRLDIDGLLPGMGNADVDGVWHDITPSTLPCTDPDPPHSWSSSRTQLADADCSGFVRAYQARGSGFDIRQCIAWQSRAQQPISYALADEFGLCQRWFSSVLTSTWPNRVYFHAAQSQGIPDNRMPLPESKFTCRTLWDQLTDAGVDWRYYYTDLPTLALWARADWAERLRPMSAFHEDAAAGTLPTVCCVDPGANFNDDHPPHHPMLGQLFLGSIAQSLMDSPHWERSMFIATYDEAGGFFDHVVPPTFPDDFASAGFDQAGFRVPALVVGPYVRQGHVSSTVFDHTAAMAFVREWLGIDETLTARDAASASLSEFLDLDRILANQPRAPIQLPAISLSEDDIVAQCERGGWRSGQPELQAAVQAFQPGWDRSADAPAMARDFFRRVGEQGLWVPA
jgi:phospholipase C